MSTQIDGRILYRKGDSGICSKEKGRRRYYVIKFIQARSVSEASKTIGRKIVWRSGNCTIPGRIVALHGRKGLVRAKFRRGLPGQALGTVVKLGG